MINAKGLYTGMILLDLQKAFDIVNHSIVCNKLKLVGISTNKWILLKKQKSVGQGW